MKRLLAAIIALLLPACAHAQDGGHAMQYTSSATWLATSPANSMSVANVNQPAPAYTVAPWTHPFSETFPDDGGGAGGAHCTDLHQIYFAGQGPPSAGQKMWWTWTGNGGQTAKALWTPNGLTCSGGHLAMTTAISGTLATLDATAQISGTTLTFASSTGTAVAIGQIVQGAAVATNTQITAGSGLSWTVSVSQNVGPEAMTTVSWQGAQIGTSTVTYAGGTTNGCPVGSCFQYGMWVANITFPALPAGIFPWLSLWGNGLYYTSPRPQPFGEFDAVETFNAVSTYQINAHFFPPSVPTGSQLASTPTAKSLSTTNTLYGGTHTIAMMRCSNRWATFIDGFEIAELNTTTFTDDLNNPWIYYLDITLNALPTDTTKSYTMTVNTLDFYQAPPGAC